MQAGIEAVAPLALNDSLVPAARIDAAGAGAGDFARLMERELGELNSNVASAETAVRDLASGKPVELHDVMISLERAKLSVQAFVQIRNKLVESYQDLMRMQM